MKKFILISALICIITYIATEIYIKHTPKEGIRCNNGEHMVMKAQEILCIKDFNYINRTHDQKNTIDRQPTGK